MADTDYVGTVGSGLPAIDARLPSDVFPMQKALGGAASNFTDTREILGASGRAWDFTVFIGVDGLVYGYDTRTSEVLTTGTTLQSVVNACFLTDPTRDYPLTVCVAGNYSGAVVADTTAWIALPDWSTLIITGYIEFDSSQFLNTGIGNVGANGSGPNSNVQVLGPGMVSGGSPGTLDPSMNPLKFAQVDGLTIRGVTVVDSSKHLLSMTDCNNVSVTHNKFRGAGDDHISILGSEPINPTTPYTDNTQAPINNVSQATYPNYPRVYDISDNEFWEAKDSSGGSAAIEVEDGTSVLTISNNYIHDVSKAISVIVDENGHGVPESISITGNTITRIESHGIEIAMNSSDTTTPGNIARSVSITGNNISYIDGRNASGIKATRVEGCTITGNVLYSVDGRGIQTLCNHVIITGNTIHNTGLQAITCVNSGVDVADAMGPALLMGNTILNANGAEADRAVLIQNMNSCQIIGLCVTDDRAVKLTSNAVRFAHGVDYGGEGFYLVQGVYQKGSTASAPISNGGGFSGTSPVIGLNGPVETQAFEFTNVTYS